MAQTLPHTPATPLTPGTPALVNGDDQGLDEVSKPPPGIVLPPRDIRAIVEKTAGYVARNGQVFEQRIREKEKHNPKFAFLNPADPYHAFYDWRLEEIRAGRGSLLAAGRTGQAATPAPAAQAPSGPAEPPEFRFSARMPNISAQDLDIVRLTALFVAKHGRSFLTPLSQREARNYQFDFLRPNHSMYQYFSRLIDQYTELLQPKGGPSIEELTKNIENKFHILDKAKARADWTRHKEKERAKKEEEEDAERLAYAQIDWHDFVVVETVVFTEADEQTDLPPPTSLNELQSASLEQKALMSLHPTQLRIEEAMPTADPYVSSYAPPPQPVPAPAPVAAPPPQPQPQPQPQLSFQPPPTAASPPPPPAQPLQQPQQNPSAMRIRTDYAPRALQKLASSSAAMGICPNCGQSIPLSEMDAHMRIELLDPRWKEQRARADAKFANTNLSTNDTVNNLKRLASQREDLFDGDNSQSVENGAKRKAVEAWDGTKEGAQRAEARKVDVREQIEGIYRKAKGVVEPGVGPRREG